jgi:hypothetical protein
MEAQKPLFGEQQFSIGPFLILDVCSKNVAKDNFTFHAHRLGL